MARVRHLQHAPIIEALIELRIQRLAGFRVDRFEEVSEILRGGYSKTGQIASVEARLGFQDGMLAAPAVTNEVLGLRFDSTDGRAIGQFRSNGFTFNRLAPYTSWDEIFPEALRLWGIYSRLTGPVAVTRVAVRYINRLVLPDWVVELSRYLVAPPAVAPLLPQSFRSFLTRVVICDESRNLSATVTQATEPSAGQNPVVLLDVDAYRDVDFAADDHRLEAVFKALHEFKNQVFFESLTEEALRLFE